MTCDAGGGGVVAAAWASPRCAKGSGGGRYLRIRLGTRVPGEGHEVVVVALADGDAPRR